MKPALVWGAVSLCAALSGCGLFSSSAKPVVPRQLHVTLVGGAHLNVSPDGQPRPIQACVYIVRTADWVPMAQADSSACVSREQDEAVLGASRHIIAPNQVMQFYVDVPRTGEIWLVTDADYARRPAGYAPLRIHVEGDGLIHYAVWLDGNGIFDASRPGPVPVATGMSSWQTESLPPPPRPQPVGAADANAGAVRTVSASARAPSGGSTQTVRPAAGTPADDTALNVHAAPVANAAGGNRITGVNRITGLDSVNTINGTNGIGRSNTSDLNQHFVPAGPTSSEVSTLRAKRPSGTHRQRGKAKRTPLQPQRSGEQP